MRHIPDGALRRLVDEPFAVPDGDAAHVEACARCASRRSQVASDAAVVTALLIRPQPVPDVDSAWNRLQAASLTPAQPWPKARGPRLPALWGRRLVVVRVPSRAALATVGIVLAAVAAAVTVTTVLAPPGRAPVASSPAGIKALEDVVGIDKSGVLGGFDKSSGSLSLPFGALVWSSPRPARRVASVSAAEQATGIDLRVPTALPAGVGNPSTILVQPEVTATIRLDTAAGTLAGHSLTVTAGPAVLVEYGASSSAIGIPTLATFAMGGPRISSADAIAAQLEAYVLSRPGLPAGLAQEIRLLGGIGTVVPLPTSQGADLTQVDVNGSPGILITDASIGASGVIWVSRNGVVHAAVGLLDRNDILNVASQLG